VLKNQEMVLYLQLGRQVVDFGNLTQWKSKLDRFKVFYKEILPRKGWNAYRKISLRFDKQIICE
jgi:cell division protein FtsQ